MFTGIEVALYSGDERDPGILVRILAVLEAVWIGTPLHSEAVLFPAVVILFATLEAKP